MASDEESTKPSTLCAHDEGAIDSRNPPDYGRDGRATNKPTDSPEDHISDWAFRLVPLIHSGFVGHAAGNLALGVLIGCVVSAAIDFLLGNRSLGRTLTRRSLIAVCPIVAAATRRLAAGSSAFGFLIPAPLREMECRSGESPQ